MDSLPSTLQKPLLATVDASAHTVRASCRKCSQALGTYNVARYMNSLGSPPGYAPRTENDAEQRMSAVLKSFNSHF